MTLRWRSALVVVTTAWMVAACGDTDCESSSVCEDDEIFHIDGEAVYRSLSRWLLVAVAALAVVAVGRACWSWVRNRWFPGDADW